jgi:hypothetical protein
VCGRAPCALAMTPPPAVVPIAPPCGLDGFHRCSADEQQVSTCPPVPVRTGTRHALSPGTSRAVLSCRTYTAPGGRSGLYRCFFPMSISMVMLVGENNVGKSTFVQLQRGFSGPMGPAYYPCARMPSTWGLASWIACLGDFSPESIAPSAAEMTCIISSYCAMNGWLKAKFADSTSGRRL